MTKFDIHDELGVVIMTPPSEGNQELSDEEAREYRRNIEVVNAAFRTSDELHKALFGNDEIMFPLSPSERLEEILAHLNLYHDRGEIEPDAYFWLLENLSILKTEVGGQR